MLILLGVAAASLAVMLLRKRLIASAARPRIDVRAGAFTELANRQLAARQGLLAAHAADADEHVPADERLALLDPPSLLGAGRAERPAAESLVAETAATLGLVGAMSVESWHSVDPDVYQTFAQLTHENVIGFWDLARVVDSHHYDLANAAFARNLGGHVAEFHFRDDLIHSGVHVEMAHAANNPGWDLNLDGEHLLNVKNHADLAHAAAMHFAANPDVAIGAPSDAHGIPAHALHFNPGEHFDPSALAEHHAVLVDNAMHLGDGVGSIHHAADLLHGGGVPDHAFPVATLIIDSYREGKKYFRGDTNLVRGGANVAVDIVGVAGGAKVGALAGTAIGAHFAGVGAIPGAAIGAVLGGLVGKLGAHEAKEIPLVHAQHALVSAATAYHEAEGQAGAEAQEAWRHEQARRQAAFHRQVRALEKQQASFARRSQDALADVLFVDRASASATLNEADRQAQALLESWRESQGSWLRRLLTRANIEQASEAFESDWRPGGRPATSCWARGSATPATPSASLTSC